MSVCVCEHSLVVPFSSPPLCGCRPKTAVRGIRGTIHQLPVNTKYICCILHHQYINTEYINTKYARCILGPPSLSWVLSSRIDNRQLQPWSLHQDVVKPCETDSASSSTSFSILLDRGPLPHTHFHHDEILYYFAWSHTHTLIFVMCVTSPAMWGEKDHLSRLNFTGKVRNKSFRQFLSIFYVYFSSVYLWVVGWLLTKFTV